MAYYFSPFRKTYDSQKKDGDSSCTFCDPNIRMQAIPNSEGAVVENEHYIWIVNYYPRFEGHTMLVPKKHITQFDQEGKEETYARQHLLSYASSIIMRLYENAGIEVFLQTGAGSASSINHLHWHLVPAKPDDVLRSFEKIGHFMTPEAGKEKVVIFPIEIERARDVLQAALATLVRDAPYRAEI